MSANSEPIHESANRMKTEWNERALENAEYFIASTEFSSEEQFAASGRRDVSMLFDGLEYLIHAEQKVLDLGCGIGRMDQVLAPIVRSIVGVDVSSEMVSKAKARLSQFDNASFVEVSGCDLAPIPDNSISLLFSHIVFQHIPKSVVLAYITDAYRILTPGGQLVFQVPERLADSPPDPAADDTFGMRYYNEDEIKYLMNLMEYRDVSFARLAATEADSVNHLRVTARTKSVFEKMANTDQPTDLEFEEWAYTWCPTAPEGWILRVANESHLQLFLKFAADPGCPQRDWFLAGLYHLSAKILNSQEAANGLHKDLQALTDRARNHHGHEWVVAWANAVESIKDPNRFDSDSWLDGRRAHDDVAKYLEAESDPLTKRFEQVVQQYCSANGIEAPEIDLKLITPLLSGASSPTCLEQRIQSHLPTGHSTKLSGNLWYAWRRAIEDAN